MLISGSRPRKAAGAVANPCQLAAPSRASCWRVFFVLFAVALAYTCYTQHAWEDYYITYRASKNLAMGHGLTFTVGERVHSFTSPLGVLLPALASVLTGNTSDAGALWIFRVMSISAYAGAGVWLWRLGRGMFAHLYPAVFLVLLLATDAKTIDTATNGMESAFVVLFMVWNLWALFLAPERRAVHLGLAWAGLMWTRPDSFIYIGALALGVLLFGRFEAAWGDRRKFLRDCLIAGAITTAVYGPWLLWAWWYYGSPIPHTIVAKGVWMPPLTAHNLGSWLMQFPVKLVHGGGTLGTTFMPPYAMNTGWPLWQIRISAYLSLAVILVWLVPVIRWEARVTSFAFTIAHFYLTYFANFPMPWYLPTVTLLGFLTLAGVVDHAVRWRPRRKPADAGEDGARSWRPHWAVLTTLMLPAGALLLLLGTAWEMRLYQTINENSNRRPMAEWLKANAASPHDTVVVECLGYVGFFSNLKMYDYPGLSSPEVVEVLRRSPTRADYTHYFPEIIRALAPNWVVLRANELEEVNLLDRELLPRYYERMRVFDCRAKIDAIKFLPGRLHLTFDSHFEVFHRIAIPPREAAPPEPVAMRVQPITLASLIAKHTATGDAYDSQGNLLAHAPSLLTVAVPRGAGVVSGQFGFFAGAYERPDPTLGAIFTVTAIAADGRRTQLFTRSLDPAGVAGDRGLQSFAAAITAANATLVEFVVEPPPGKSNAYDWTFWTNLKFGFPQK